MTAIYIINPCLYAILSVLPYDGSRYYEAGILWQVAIDNYIPRPQCPCFVQSHPTLPAVTPRAYGSGDGSMRGMG